MNCSYQTLGAFVVAMQAMGTLTMFGQALPAATPAPATTTGKPVIRFSETTFDFGKVKPTEPQKHVFVVTNTGDAELEITDVKPGCGCTTAGEWDKKIAPGKTGNIPIAFNPINFSGTVGKSVMVSCNDAAQPSHILSISATIWRPLDIQPQYTHFLPIEGETNAEVRVVRITNNTEDEIKIEAPESTNPQFKAELTNLRPNKEWEMTVTYLGAISNNPPNGMIHLKTSAPGTPQLSISAYAMPQAAISAMPPNIQLPAGPLGPSYAYPMAIRNNGSKPIVISDAAVNAEGVTVKLQESMPGKQFNITLGFPSDFKVPAGKLIELTAKTSHPKYPLLHVPIIQPTPPPLPSPQVIAPPVTPIINK